MPFARPTLTELRDLVSQDIAAALPGTDPLLRFSNLSIMGEVLAGLTHLHYGYLDWIALQSNPATATDEYLEAWAALKGVTREPATSASGPVSFAGSNGTVLPAGTALSRADGKTFTTTTSGTVSGGSVTVNATADADPEGLTGAWGNMAAGSVLTLAASIDGINSNGTTGTWTGGADIETDDSLKARMLERYQNPPHGGAAADYVAWAEEVPGVTRAWCVPNGAGAGTVQVFVMLDETESAHGGFPQGTDGVATLELRGTPATGDQLAVANHIYSLRPVTALVSVYAPGAYTQNFTITGLASADPSVRTNVTSAISGVLRQYGELGGTVALSLIESEIAAVAGTSGFVITSPTANITAGAGQIPVLGTVTYP